MNRFFYRRDYWNITLSLIIINVVIFFFVLIAQIILKTDLTSFFAIRPIDFLSGKKLWTLITSMFMHAGFMHLFINMISLMFLGSFLERIIGSKKFLIVYFLSGIFGGILFCLSALFFPNSMNAYAVGASGAIFGLGGMLAILTPKVPVYMFFIPIAMPLWLGITLALIVMWVLSIVAGLPIGNFAHLGGFLTGLIYGLILKTEARKRMFGFL